MHWQCAIGGSKQSQEQTASCILDEELAVLDPPMAPNLPHLGEDSAAGDIAPPKEL